MLKTSKTLEKLYYDLQNPAGYSSEKKLIQAARAAKIDRKVVIDWLQGQDAHTLHKPIRRRYRRSRYHLLGIDDLWQADLAVLDSISKWNSGFKYLLVVIDCFSKFVWVVPTKAKTAEHILDALKHILSLISRRPRNFMTDRGGEFLNAKLKAYFKSQRINFYTAENPDTKCAFAERVIRTLKSRIFRYLTHKRSWRYVDVLNQLVDAYNNSVHRTTGMKPSQVSKYDESLLRSKLNPKVKLEVARLKINDYVRISKLKQNFEKGYMPNWSEEIFRVSKIIKSNPVRYKIIDYNEETILGSFYGQELQKVHKKEMFDIEEVLQKKNNKLLVKWKGYPKSMASWIDAKDINIKR